MIMPKYNDFLPFLSILALLGACGVERSPHFDEDNKNFGMETSDDGDEKIIETDESETGSETAEDDAIDPNQTVFLSSFQGKIDVNSAKILYHGIGSAAVEEYRPDETSANGQFLKTKPVMEKSSVNLVAQQTLGNDQVALFSQQVKMDLVDVKPGTEDLFPSMDGRTTYDRTFHKDCPMQLICVNRVRVRPVKGMPSTYCFRNALNHSSYKNAPVSFLPFGASPTLTKKELAKIGNKFGPYYVVKYNLGDVDCQNTTLKPDTEYPPQKIIVRISFAKNVKKMEALADKYNTISIDFGLKFTVNRMIGNSIIPANKLPYIDMTSDMQAETTYYVSESQKTLVLLQKVFRLPLNMYVYQGLKAEINFRYCSDLLIKDSPNYCEGNNR